MSMAQYDWLFVVGVGLFNLGAWIRIARLARTGTWRDSGFLIMVAVAPICAVGLFLLVKAAVQVQSSALALRLQVDMPSVFLALAFLVCGTMFFLYEFARMTMPRVARR